MKWMRAFHSIGKMDYLFDGISVRNGRPSNMDSLAVLEREHKGKKLLLAVVCDGVGSLEDGDYASTMATKSLMGWFYALDSVNDLLKSLCNEIYTINSEILEISESKGLQTATTLSALVLAEQKYYIAHVGDSRVYVLRGGKIRQLTRDDVSERGELTECIGYMQDPLIQSVEGRVGDDVFLVCSDGLYRRMDEQYLIRQMNVKTQDEIKAAISSLVGYAEQRGEKDNISLAIVKTCNGGVTG